MTASVKQTMDDARTAMSAFAENMEALKHNFLRARLLQGPRLLQPRGDLAGGLPEGRADQGRRSPRVRVWLSARMLFEPEPEHPADERLTDDGQGAARLGDRRLSSTHVASGVLMVEGYAQQGTPDEQYLRSRARASLVRDYLIGKFHLDSADDRRRCRSAATRPAARTSAPWDGCGCRSRSCAARRCRTSSRTGRSTRASSASPPNSV